MNQDGDKKWLELCQAAATEHDSKKLIELLAQLNKELDKRHSPPEPTAEQSDNRDNTCCGAGLALEMTEHAKATYGLNSRACSK